MKQKFNVTGMTCTACSAHVEKAVNGVPGVEACNVNLLGNSMLVEYTYQTNAEEIIHAVEEAGYGASLPAPAGQAAPAAAARPRSEEHTSELQSPILISYAVFCLKKKKK